MQEQIPLGPKKKKPKQKNKTVLFSSLPDVFYVITGETKISKKLLLVIPLLFFKILSSTYRTFLLIQSGLKI